MHYLFFAVFRLLFCTVVSATGIFLDAFRFCVPQWPVRVDCEHRAAGFVRLCVNGDIAHTLLKYINKYKTEKYIIKQLTITAK
jgi:hypothetical protein